MFVNMKRQNFTDRQECNREILFLERALKEDKSFHQQLELLVLFKNATSN